MNFRNLRFLKGLTASTGAGRISGNVTILRQPVQVEFGKELRLRSYITNYCEPNVQRGGGAVG